MMTFAMPWAFAILPLPWVVWKFAPPIRTHGAAVRVPFFRTFSSIKTARKQPAGTNNAVGRLRMMALIAGWCFLVTALARPQWVGPPVIRTEAARNIMVAVDLSGSMETRDMQPGAETGRQSRLEAVKNNLRTFAAAREHDRLGLIAFGSAAYVQAPFTDDHISWLQLLDELQPGMAGERTMLGDAIGLAIDTLRRSDTESRVLLLLTDGRDTGSSMPPIEAARIARFYDIRIHAVAVGRTDGAEPESADMETLRGIAEETGGRAFKAVNIEALDQIVGEFAAIEPEIYETRRFNPYYDLFHIPLACLGLGIVAAAAAAAITAGIQKHRGTGNYVG